jgi:hypothetical protein
MDKERRNGERESGSSIERWVKGNEATTVVVRRNETRGKQRNGEGERTSDNTSGS